MGSQNKPKEGDLYAVLEVGGHRLEMRYGYNEEYERGRIDPIPIYPDFLKYPMYDQKGYPLTTRIQEPCEHYQVLEGHTSEECCEDCIYYPGGLKDHIGICKCEKRRINPAGLKKNSRHGGSEK